MTTAAFHTNYFNFPHVGVLVRKGMRIFIQYQVHQCHVFEHIGNMSD